MVSEMPLADLYARTFFEGYRNGRQRDERPLPLLLLAQRVPPKWTIRCSNAYRMLSTMNGEGSD